jgi:hypothetical protein
MPSFFKLKKAIQPKNKITRNDLIKAFDAANKTTDLNNSLTLYTKILKVLSLEKRYFSRKETADVYFNRGMNYTEITELHLKAEDYSKAKGMIERALFEMTCAHLHYTAEDDKAACATYLQKYTIKRETIIDTSEEHQEVETQQQFTRHELVQLFKRANHPDLDEDESNALYTNILTANATQHFKREEIAAIYYNRAINKTIKAEKLSQQKNLSPVLFLLRNALSDFRSAQVRYPKKQDKETCSGLIEIYRQERQAILKEKENQEKSNLHQLTF